MSKDGASWIRALSSAGSNKVMLAGVTVVPVWNDMLIYWCWDLRGADEIVVPVFSNHQLCLAKPPLTSFRRGGGSCGAAVQFALCRLQAKCTTTVSCAGAESGTLNQQKGCRMSFKGLNERVLLASHHCYRDRSLQPNGSAGDP